MSENCRDCGFDEFPSWEVIPHEEYTRIQRIRVRLFGGAYMRDQFGDVSYDPDIEAND